MHVKLSFLLNFLLLLLLVLPNFVHVLKGERQINLFSFKFFRLGLLFFKDLHQVIIQNEVSVSVHLFVVQLLHILHTVVQFSFVL